MANYVKVAQKKDVTAGRMKTVTAGGKNIALANIGGEIFAVDDVCTHAGCSLSGEGHLETATIVCGCHGSKFDAKTGKVLGLPATVPLNSYPVKIEGEDILISI